MTFSANYKPFMTYLEPKDITRLKRFAKAHKMPMTQIVREGINSRLSSGNQYTSGFNEGLIKAINIVGNIEAAQMRFPSGMSFAELVEQEVRKSLMREGAGNEADRQS